VTERGFFIVLEGPEGAGKTTQARALADRLQAAGHRVLLTREPGGTAIGEQIRQILLDHANSAMLAATEALLYSAARAQHVGEVVGPALAAGTVVVCDRYVDSTLAYQGGGRGLPPGELRAVQAMATGGLVPDLRILLDLPIEVGLRRRFGGAEPVNRLDAADVAFHERVRQAYLELAVADPAGWVVVDAEGESAAVAGRVAAAVTARLTSGSSGQ
jgi:dTMP kinase